MQRQVRSPASGTSRNAVQTKKPAMTPTNAKSAPRESKDLAFQRDWVGNLGWGVTKPDFQVTERHCLPDKPFQWSLEKGMKKDDFFLDASGWHPDKLDTWLGLPYHKLDQLSIRE